MGICVNRTHGSLAIRKYDQSSLIGHILGALWVLLSSAYSRLTALRCVFFAHSPTHPALFLKTLGKNSIAQSVYFVKKFPPMSFPKHISDQK